MVHHHVAVEGLAYLYLVLVIVVYGLSVNLSVRKAVAAALLHIVQNVGDAVVDVLGRVAVVLGEEFVLRCTLLQVHLYRSLKMVCSFHIACCFIGYRSCKVSRSPPPRWAVRRGGSGRNRGAYCRPRP